MKRLVLSFGMIALVSGIALAQDAAPAPAAAAPAVQTAAPAVQTADELATESAARCTATANDKTTPEEIMAKVIKAVELIEKDGAKAYPLFKGKDSEFLFAGTYVWVNDMDGKMLMHPIKNKMEGQSTLGMKDTNGKQLFVDFIDVCQTKGAGWVDYYWPKPGEKAGTQKISYVKKAKCDGVDVVVGCGIYGVSPEEIAKLVGGK